MEDGQRREDEEVLDKFLATGSLGDGKQINGLARRDALVMKSTVGELCGARRRLVSEVQGGQREQREGDELAAQGHGDNIAAEEVLHRRVGRECGMGGRVPVEHELEIVHAESCWRAGIEMDSSPAGAEHRLGGVGVLGFDDVALGAILFAPAALGFLLIALEQLSARVRHGGTTQTDLDLARFADGTAGADLSVGFPCQLDGVSAEVDVHRSTGDGVVVLKGGSHDWCLRSTALASATHGKGFREGVGAGLIGYSRCVLAQMAVHQAPGKRQAAS